MQLARRMFPDPEPANTHPVPFRFASQPVNCRLAPPVTVTENPGTDPLESARHAVHRVSAPSVTNQPPPVPLPVDSQSVHHESARPFVCTPQVPQSLNFDDSTCQKSGLCPVVPSSVASSPAPPRPPTPAWKPPHTTTSRIFTPPTYPVDWMPFTVFPFGSSDPSTVIPYSRCPPCWLVPALPILIIPVPENPAVALMTAPCNGSAPAP